jgi:hypothetical protein
MVSPSKKIACILGQAKKNNKGGDVKGIGT